jgi:hypothetical protein
MASTRQLTRRDLLNKPKSLMKSDAFLEAEAWRHRRAKILPEFAKSSVSITSGIHDHYPMNSRKSALRLQAAGA